MCHHFLRGSGILKASSKVSFGGKRCNYSGGLYFLLPKRNLEMGEGKGFGGLLRIFIDGGGLLCRHRSILRKWQRLLLLPFLWSCFAHVLLLFAWVGVCQI